MRHFHSAVQKTEPQTDMCRCQGHTASVGDTKRLVGKVIDTQSPSVAWSLTGRWSLKEKAYMYQILFLGIQSQEKRKQAFFMRLSHFLDWEVISSEWNAQEIREINYGVTLRKQLRRNSAGATNEQLPGYYAGFGKNSCNIISRW